MLIVGPTGAGKSAQPARLALQFRRYPGSQVYIFDKGFSARAAVLAMGGAHHALDLGGEDESWKAIAFQPLRHIDRSDERAWAAEWIGALLAHEKVLITPEVNEAVGRRSPVSQPLQSRNARSLVLRCCCNRHRCARRSRPIRWRGPFGRLLDTAEDDLAIADVQCFETERWRRRAGAYPLSWIRSRRWR